MATAQKTFPWLPASTPTYHQAFRHNIKEFLHAFGSLVPLKLQLTTAWIVQLQHKGDIVKLHVYEEHLDEDSGEPAICDQCRNMGWQHHPVSNQRYHFILPSPAVLSDPDQLPSLVEAAAAGRLDAAKAALSNLSVEVYGKDTTDSAFNAPASIFDSTTHCLHGLIHANGFGHLLRVNGRDGAAATAAAMAAAAQEEGGSASASAVAAAAASAGVSLAGPELVGLWDALCSTLRTREVSVEDVSNKSLMLLRLLYSAAHKRTWYGKWGYDFGRAAFNYGAEEYTAAVEAVNSAPVAALLRDMEGIDPISHKILRTYWTLPPTMPTDATFGQLLKRMLFFISRPEALKEARMQHIAAVKAAASAVGKPAGQEQGGAAGAGAAAGPGGPAETTTPALPAGPGRKAGRGGKTPLTGGSLPPAKRGRRSAPFGDEPGDAAGSQAALDGLAAAVAPASTASTPGAALASSTPLAALAPPAASAAAPVTAAPSPVPGTASAGVLAAPATSGAATCTEGSGCVPTGAAPQPLPAPGTVTPWVPPASTPLPSPLPTPRAATPGGFGTSCTAATGFSGTTTPAAATLPGPGTGPWSALIAASTALAHRPPGTVPGTNTGLHGSCFPGAGGSGMPVAPSASVAIAAAAAAAAAAALAALAAGKVATTSAGTGPGSGAGASAGSGPPPYASFLTPQRGLFQSPLLQQQQGRPQPPGPLLPQLPQLAPLPQLTPPPPGQAQAPVGSGLPQGTQPPQPLQPQSVPPAPAPGFQSSQQILPSPIAQQGLAPPAAPQHPLPVTQHQMISQQPPSQQLQAPNTFQPMPGLSNPPFGAMPAGYLPQFPFPLWGFPSRPGGFAPMQQPSTPVSAQQQQLLLPKQPPHQPFAAQPQQQLLPSPQPLQPPQPLQFAGSSLLPQQQPQHQQPTQWQGQYPLLQPQQQLPSQLGGPQGVGQQPVTRQGPGQLSGCQAGVLQGPGQQAVQAPPLAASTAMGAVGALAPQVPSCADSNGLALLGGPSGTAPGPASGLPGVPSITCPPALPGSSPLWSWQFFPQPALPASLPLLAPAAQQWAPPPTTQQGPLPATTPPQSQQEVLLAGQMGTLPAVEAPTTAAQAALPATILSGAGAAGMSQQQQPQPSQPPPVQPQQPNIATPQQQQQQPQQKEAAQSGEQLGQQAVPSVPSAAAFNVSPEALAALQHLAQLGMLTDGQESQPAHEAPPQAQDRPSRPHATPQQEEAQQGVQTQQRTCLQQVVQAGQQTTGGPGVQAHPAGDRASELKAQPAVDGSEGLPAPQVAAPEQGREGVQPADLAQSLRTLQALQTSDLGLQSQQPASLEPGLGPPQRAVDVALQGLLTKQPAGLVQGTQAPQTAVVGQVSQGQQAPGSGPQAQEATLPGHSATAAPGALLPQPHALPQLEPDFFTFLYTSQLQQASPSLLLPPPPQQQQQQQGQQQWQAVAAAAGQAHPEESQQQQQLLLQPPQPTLPAMSQDSALPPPLPLFLMDQQQLVPGPTGPATGGTGAGGGGTEGWFSWPQLGLPSGAEGTVGTGALPFTPEAWLQQLQQLQLLSQATGFQLFPPEAAQPAIVPSNVTPVAALQQPAQQPARVDPPGAEAGDPAEAPSSDPTQHSQPLQPLLPQQAQEVQQSQPQPVTVPPQELSQQQLAPVAAQPLQVGSCTSQEFLGLPQPPQLQLMSGLVPDPAAPTQPRGEAPAQTHGSFSQFLSYFSLGFPQASQDSGTVSAGNLQPALPVPYGGSLLPPEAPAQPLGVSGSRGVEPPGGQGQPSCAAELAAALAVVAGQPAAQSSAGTSPPSSLHAAGLEAPQLVKTEPSPADPHVGVPQPASDLAEQPGHTIACPPPAAQVHPLPEMLPNCSSLQIRGPPSNLPGLFPDNLPDSARVLAPAGPGDVGTGAAPVVPVPPHGVAAAPVAGFSVPVAAAVSAQATSELAPAAGLAAAAAPGDTDDLWATWEALGPLAEGGLETAADPPDAGQGLQGPQGMPGLGLPPSVAESDMPARAPGLGSEMAEGHVGGAGAPEVSASAAAGIGVDVGLPSGLQPSWHAASAIQPDVAVAGATAAAAPAATETQELSAAGVVEAPAAAAAVATDVPSDTVGVCASDGLVTEAAPRTDTAAVVVQEASAHPRCRLDNGAATAARGLVGLEAQPYAFCTAAPIDLTQFVAGCPASYVPGGHTTAPASQGSVPPAVPGLGTGVGLPPQAAASVPDQPTLPSATAPPVCASPTAGCGSGLATEAQGPEHATASSQGHPPAVQPGPTAAVDDYGVGGGVGGQPECLQPSAPMEVDGCAATAQGSPGAADSDRQQALIAASHGDVGASGPAGRDVSDVRSACNASSAGREAMDISPASSPTDRTAGAPDGGHHSAPCALATAPTFPVADLSSRLAAAGCSGEPPGQSTQDPTATHDAATIMVAGTPVTIVDATAGNWPPVSPSSGPVLPPSLQQGPQPGPGCASDATAAWQRALEELAPPQACGPPDSPHQSVPEKQQLDPAAGLACQQGADVPTPPLPEVGPHGVSPPCQDPSRLLGDMGAPLPSPASAQQPEQCHLVGAATAVGGCAVPHGAGRGNELVVGHKGEAQAQEHRCSPDDENASATAAVETGRDTEHSPVGAPLEAEGFTALADTAGVAPLGPQLAPLGSDPGLTAALVPLEGGIPGTAAGAHAAGELSVLPALQAPAAVSPHPGPDGAQAAKEADAAGQGVLLLSPNGTDPGLVGGHAPLDVPLQGSPTENLVGPESYTAVPAVPCGHAAMVLPAQAAPSCTDDASGPQHPHNVAPRVCPDPGSCGSAGAGVADPGPSDLVSGHEGGSCQGDGASASGTAPQIRSAVAAGPRADMPYVENTGSAAGGPAATNIAGHHEGATAGGGDVDGSGHGDGGAGAATQGQPQQEVHQLPNGYGPASGGAGDADCPTARGMSPDAKAGDPGEGEPDAGAAVPVDADAGTGAGASGGGGGGGRGRQPPKASGAHIGPAPDHLPREPVSELPELRALPDPDMNLRDCQRAMDCMLQALKSHCQEQWLARLQLRDVMMVSYRDYKVLDWVLKQVANVRVCGYAVFRSKYVVTRSFYYRLERLPGTPPDAPLSYTVPMPSHGPYARKVNRHHKGRTGMYGAAAKARSAAAARAAAAVAATDDAAGDPDADGARPQPPSLGPEAEPHGSQHVGANVPVPGGTAMTSRVHQSGVEDATEVAQPGGTAAGGIPGSRTDADPAVVPDTGAAAAASTVQAGADQAAAAGADAPGAVTDPASSGGGVAAGIGALTGAVHGTPSAAMAVSEATTQMMPNGLAGGDAAVEGAAAPAAKAATRSSGEVAIRGGAGEIGSGAGAATGANDQKQLPNGPEAADGRQAGAAAQVEEARADESETQTGAKAATKKRPGGKAAAAAKPRNKAAADGSATAGRGSKRPAGAAKGDGTTPAASSGAPEPATLPATPVASGKGGAVDGALHATAAGAGATPATPPVAKASGTGGASHTPSEPRPHPASASRGSSALWRDHAKEHQSEGQALLESVLESRIEVQQPGGPGGAPAKRVPRELRYLMSKSTLSKLKQQEQQQQQQAQKVNRQQQQQPQVAQQKRLQRLQYPEVKQEPQVEQDREAQGLQGQGTAGAGAAAAVTVSVREEAAEAALPAAVADTVAGPVSPAAVLEVKQAAPDAPVVPGAGSGDLVVAQKAPRDDTENALVFAAGAQQPAVKAEARNPGDESGGGEAGCASDAGAVEGQCGGRATADLDLQPPQQPQRERLQQEAESIAATDAVGVSGEGAVVPPLAEDVCRDPVATVAQAPVDTAAEAPDATMAEAPNHQEQPDAPSRPQPTPGQKALQSPPPLSVPPPQQSGRPQRARLASKAALEAAESDGPPQRRRRTVEPRASETSLASRDPIDPGGRAAGGQEADSVPAAFPDALTVPRKPRSARKAPRRSASATPAAATVIAAMLAPTTAPTPAARAKSPQPPARNTAAGAKPAPAQPVPAKSAPAKPAPAKSAPGKPAPAAGVATNDAKPAPASGGGAAAKSASRRRPGAASTVVTENELDFAAAPGAAIGGGPSAPVASSTAAGAARRAGPDVAGNRPPARAAGPGERLRGKPVVTSSGVAKSTSSRPGGEEARPTPASARATGAPPFASAAAPADATAAARTGSAGGAPRTGTARAGGSGVRLGPARAATAVSGAQGPAAAATRPPVSTLPRGTTGQGLAKGGKSGAGSAGAKPAEPATSEAAMTAGTASATAGASGPKRLATTSAAPSGSPGSSPGGALRIRLGRVPHATSSPGSPVNGQVPPGPPGPPGQATSPGGRQSSPLTGAATRLDPLPSDAAAKAQGEGLAALGVEAKVASGAAARRTTVSGGTRAGSATPAAVAGEAKRAASAQAATPARAAVHTCPSDAHISAPAAAAAAASAPAAKRQATGEPQQSGSRSRSQDGPSGWVRSTKRQKMTHSATLATGGGGGGGQQGSTATTRRTVSTAARAGAAAAAGGAGTGTVKVSATVSTATVGPRAGADGAAGPALALDTATSGKGGSVDAAAGRGPQQPALPLPASPTSAPASAPGLTPALAATSGAPAVGPNPCKAAQETPVVPRLKVEQPGESVQGLGWPEPGAGLSGKVEDGEAKPVSEADWNGQPGGVRRRPPRPPSRVNSQLRKAVAAVPDISGGGGAAAPGGPVDIDGKATPLPMANGTTAAADQANASTGGDGEVYPSPAAAASNTLATTLGSAASEEPYATLLRVLPLAYIHKARFSVTPGEAGSGGGSGAKRGRPSGAAASRALAAAASSGSSGGGTSFDPEPAAPTNPYITPGKAHHNTSLTYMSDQTQCDMQYLYCSILRVYKPALRTAVALMSKRAASALASNAPTIPELPYMAAAVQLLKDSKYFVKDYGGGGAEAAAAASAADGRVRVLVCLQLDEEPPEQQPQRPAGRGGGAGSKASAAVAAAAAIASVAATASHAPSPRVPRQMTLTPPEIVVVEPAAAVVGDDAVVTIGDFKRATAAMFAETYRMCKPRASTGSIVVTSIVRSLDEQALSGGDAAPLLPALAAPPAEPVGSAEEGALASVPSSAASKAAVPSLVVRCSGLDLDRRWRHAGGPEDWRVACLCGTQDDDGERMIACDVCGVWSHTRCNDIPDDLDEPPSFVCKECGRAAGGKRGGAGGKSRDRGPE